MLKGSLIYVSFGGNHPLRAPFKLNCDCVWFLSSTSILSLNYLDSLPYPQIGCGRRDPEKVMRILSSLKMWTRLYFTVIQWISCHCISTWFDFFSHLDRVVWTPKLKFLFFIWARLRSGSFVTWLIFSSIKFRILINLVPHLPCFLFHSNHLTPDN